LVANHHHQRHSKPVARLPKFLEHLHLNKGKIIPLSALIVPSVFLTGCSLDVNSSFSWLTESVQSISTMFETLDAASKEDLLHPQNHMKSLMVWIFKTVSMIIYTPVFLFDNEFFHSLIRTFAGISIGVVTLGSMVEGLKRVLGWSGSSFKQILLRLPIMIAICGFAPFGFIKAIEAMNSISNGIFAIGTNILGNSTQSDIWTFSLLSDHFETLAFLLFILLYIALLIPMMLNHGKRWFSMIALGILTPFAMLGYVFDSFKSLHHNWWTSLKSLFLVQIIYSIFVTILSLLMFAVPFPTTVEGAFAKMLVILGGLYMLAVPPTFVTGFFNQGPTPKQSYAVVAKKLGKLMLRKV
jgi:hypothetical protein